MICLLFCYLVLKDIVVVDPLKKEKENFNVYRLQIGGEKEDMNIKIRFWSLSLYENHPKFDMAQAKNIWLLKFRPDRIRLSIHLITIVYF